MSETAIKPNSGFKAWLLADFPDNAFQARCQRAYISWLSFKTNPIAMLGLFIVAFLCFVALFAPWIASGDGTTQDLANRLQPASAEHWFGTDELGRDVFDRIVWGSRITLYIIFLVSIIVMPLGLLIGTTAGLLGGMVDTVLMRVTDIFLAFPRLILALAFVAVLGPGLENAVLAIALTTWSPYARLARAETLTVRNSEYIMAAEIMGASKIRILLGHIMPMCLSSTIVRLTLDMAGIILTAAGLGFLGLGAQPPLAEWGAMIATGRDFLLDQWWVPTIPGIAILVVSLGFNLLGDGLRDVLDPRSSGGH
ncbi:ABC transporter permease [Cohaesibacter gelatinilyticus]|uniref:Peptide/nickel transport system permease protein n=1 Tax=Cohaesibacter gelatinilyticus TaxID=372072 RepID=A0A285PFJ4_9HYPH|nr:ABC transporter permease [Cohaesibacter gelatinilyticus]SNZ20484.1 peptide/nickel transport system permease protein [Cohaesibacter gelatinilyticus]